jgi:hypothetical protein
MCSLHLESQVWLVKRLTHDFQIMKVCWSSKSWDYSRLINFHYKWHLPSGVKYLSRSVGPSVLYCWYQFPYINTVAFVDNLNHCLTSISISICCFLVCSSLKWACPTLTTSRLKNHAFFYFRRDPASLVKPAKDSSTELTEKDLKNIENA